MKLRSTLLKKMFSHTGRTLFAATFAASFSSAATIQINQDDANSGNGFSLYDGDSIQLTSDVTFTGYENGKLSGGRFSYNAVGNIFFLYEDSLAPTTPPTTIMGDANKSFDLTFSNNKRTLSGSQGSNYIYLRGGAVGGNVVNFKDLNYLVFENNSLDNLGISSSPSSAMGGSIYAHHLVLTNINQFAVQNNTVSGSVAQVVGGGIYALKLDVDTVGDISFSGNSCLLQKDKGQLAYGGAFANMQGTSEYAEVWQNAGKISFINNKIAYNEGRTLESALSGRENELFGGAYYSSSKTSFINTLNIEFIGNAADATLHSNESIVKGGAMWTFRLQFEGIKSNSSDTPAILFANNRALGNTNALSEGRGGAIYTAVLSIKESGETLFANNYAQTTGGAIHLRSGSSPRGTMELIADEGNITFIGNTDTLGSSFERNSGIANAIHAYDDGTSSIISGLFNISLAAQDGYAVNFYDPITSNVEDRANLRLMLNENATDGYTGTILFSGAYAKETLAGSESSADYEDRLAASKKSEINAEITLKGGTLTLEEGVTLGRNANDPLLGSGATFSMTENSTLDISGSELNGISTLAAETMDFGGGTLKIGDLSRLDANTIDMSQGVKIDIVYYLPAISRATTISHSGLQINADSLSLGGSLTIADSADGYYYSDRFWANDTDFILFNTDGVDLLDGDFDGILSSLTGSPVVADPYQYQGEWSLEWLDNQLVAHWTSTGGIEEIRPEMDGTAMLNTLWSSASNLQAMSRVGTSQLGINRFKYGKDRNLWVQGLADFSSHGRRGDRDGYDYNGGGYAVGVDEKLSKTVVAGLGLGQLKGNNRSRGYNIKTDQNTLMGMIYGGYNKQINPKNNLDVQLVAVYGNTNNKSRTAYNRGTSHGEWDNNSWMLDLYATWTHDLSKNWSITPYIGLEYTESKQEAFTETGYAARRFGKDKLQNLSAPIGMGIAKQATFNNGVLWMGELKASYVPDLYRNNPETNATWLEHDFSWYAKGVAPARNAFRVEFNNRLQLSQSWSMYGGYMYEGRNAAHYHQVNLGASYSF